MQRLMAAAKAAGVEARICVLPEGETEVIPAAQDSILPKSAVGD